MRYADYARLAVEERWAVAISHAAAIVTAGRGGAESIEGVGRRVRQDDARAAEADGDASASDAAPQLGA